MRSMSYLVRVLARIVGDSGAAHCGGACCRAWTSTISVRRVRSCGIASLVVAGSTGVRLLRAIATVWLVAMASSASADDVPRGQSRFQVFAGADGLRNLVLGSIAQDPSG